MVNSRTFGVYLSSVSYVHNSHRAESISETTGTTAKLTRVFPLLEFTVQEAHAQAGGTCERQGGQYCVDPHVVQDDFVVHEPAVHVHRAVRTVARTDAADRRDHGRGGRGDHRLGRDRGCGHGARRQSIFHDAVCCRFSTGSGRD